MSSSRPFPSIWSQTDALIRSRRCLHQQISHPNQVVTGHGHEHLEVHPLGATEFGLAQRPDELTPTERFLDAFANPLTDAVTLMDSGAPIDGRAPVGVVLSHMRRRVQLAHISDELAGVVALVRPDGDPVRAGPLTDHRHGAVALGAARRWRDPRVHHQTVAVLHQRMTHVTQPGFLPLALAKLLRLGIGGRFMGLVAAPLAMKVPLRIPAPALGRIVRAVLAPHALHRGPSLDQRAVHRKMLVRGQPPIPGLSHDGLEEPAGDVRFQQPVPVLGEGRVVPYRVVHRQAHEPAKQQVVVELLAQQPFAANRVQNLQQRRAKQALRSDRRASVDRVNGLKIGAQLGQGRVHHLPDRPKRMVLGNPRFRGQVAEKSSLLGIGAAHRFNSCRFESTNANFINHRPRRGEMKTFSTAC